MNKKKKDKKEEGRHIVQTVDETVGIKERRIAVIRRMEKNFYYLYATLAVIIVVPLVFYFMGEADLISTIISVGAGFLGLYLGYKALTKVREVYESGDA
jgi:hypothetical protein